MKGVLAAVAALLCCAGLFFYILNQDAADEVIRLEREKAISDAIDNANGLGWRDRLHE